MFPIFVCALLVALGLRIHLHGRRNGGLPDRILGLFFLCIGLGGIPANAPEILGIPAGFHVIAAACGHALLSAASGCLAVFVWKCFGPDSPWRGQLALGTVAILAILWLAHGLIDQFGPGPVIRLNSAARGWVLVWAFCECFAYRSRIRKQLAIGLSDPVVANRFTLWSIWTGSLLLCNLVVLALRLTIDDIDAAPGWIEPATIAVVASLALVAAVALALAFFPPAWYAARLRQTRPA